MSFVKSWAGVVEVVDIVVEVVVDEEEEERARAVVTAKLPPALNPERNTFPLSIPNSSVWARIYFVASIQSLTGIGNGYSGARRYSTEMNIPPNPSPSPMSVVSLELKLELELGVVRVTQ